MSLKLLGTTSIDLLQLHWPEPGVPMATTMKAFAELVDEGLIRLVGLCNVSLEQITEARRIVPLASVQNHFSPTDQQDRPIVEYCAAEDVAYLAYSPLGGTPRSDCGSLYARFPKASAHALEIGISIQRLAVAWLLAQSPTLIPICGCSRPSTIIDSAKAVELQLTTAEATTIGFS